jgi:lipoyl(octanoyl) transferase
MAAELGVAAGAHEKHVGLWADRASPRVFTSTAEATELVKIGAIGVRISRWITMHGFALNLAPDLDAYRVIVPCGIREHGVSSIAALVGRSVAPEDAAERAHAILGELLGTSSSPLERASLASLLPRAPLVDETRA